ncbi:hypothetical protein DM860_000773 [Cuscuta australis]|uniref:Uncharacterized protein n=1 Tax=Cuscuta australis TaxID=267555 RepID=A0A328D158_9ASTE|nr:hypothetical protein DM860_000773 [Cuscuta australis]
MTDYVHYLGDLSNKMFPVYHYWSKFVGWDRQMLWVLACMEHLKQCIKSRRKGRSDEDILALKDHKKCKV